VDKIKTRHAPEILADMEKSIVQSLHDEFYKAKSTAKKEELYTKFKDLVCKYPDIELAEYQPPAPKSTAKTKVEKTVDDTVNKTAVI